jgi:hypothetical protein
VLKVKRFDKGPILDNKTNFNGMNEGCLQSKQSEWSYFQQVATSETKTSEQDCVLNNIFTMSVNEKEELTLPNIVFNSKDTFEKLISKTSKE